nr:hypothetical protein [Campylobacter sp.]
MARQISNEILANIGKKSEMVENGVSKDTKNEAVQQVVKKEQIQNSQTKSGKQISIYVSKETKEKLSQISKTKNVNLTNLIKFMENTFYEKKIEFDPNESKFSDLDKLAKNGRKVGISLILDFETMQNRAKERKFEKMSDYFDKMFEIIIPEIDK